MFEKFGTVYPETAYYVSLEGVTNTDKQDIKTMIDAGRYFSMFAPRQSGKTTFLDSIRRTLHKDKTYIIIIINFQKYKSLGKSQFYQLVEEKIYSLLIERLEEIGCEKTESVKDFLNNHHLTDHISFYKLFEQLNRLLLLKVVLIDEFDGIR